MAKFALKKIASIKGKQIFEKLVIDGKCQFDEFEEAVTKNPKYKSELASIYLYMERVADGEGLPKTKFRDITPQKEEIKEYEFKSNNLRVYAIKFKNGKIIILGGTKNRQKKDLRKFRGIKKRYIDSQ